MSDRLRRPAEFPRPFLQRIYNRVSYYRWASVYSWRFADCGTGTLVKSPFWVVGGKKIALGANVSIWRYARIEALGAGPDVVIRIGDGTIIQPFVHIGAVHSVHIGSNVLIASNVYITDHDHDYSSPSSPVIHNKQLLAAETRLDDFAWIGEGAKILSGVRVGEGSIVGAGSVVSRDVPAYHIAVGVPAKPIKRFDVNASAWVSV